MVKLTSRNRDLLCATQGNQRGGTGRRGGWRVFVSGAAAEALGRSRAHGRRELPAGAAPARYASDPVPLQLKGPGVDTLRTSRSEGAVWPGIRELRA